MAANEIHSEAPTLTDWLLRLEQLHPSTIDLGLERVGRVRAELDLKPSFPIITVGGTNGKGSSCIMLEAILSHAGYRAGCYTSPHLLRYNERVRIGRREATDPELCEAFQAIESARVRAGVSLTYFEFGTLAAMQLFIQAGVEIAILEVGLGGRLDAVNVFDADCAVLTSVDFDHMDYLGNTREMIGFEKAGIFRKGKPAICSDPDMPEAVRLHADAVGAELLHIGKHFGYSTDANGWNYWGSGGKRYSLPYPALRGVHQLRNASAGLAALDALRDLLPVTMSNVRHGLLDLVWPGRFQVLPGRPAIILDVAHNPGAASVLAECLDSMGRYRKTYAVFAMLRDKDIVGVARVLAPRVDVWLVASINAPRGASSGEIEHALEAAGVTPVDRQAEGAAQGQDATAAGSETILRFPSPAAAYAYACEQASVNDRICVFGSFHTVAEALIHKKVVHG
ncbi:dihydrofolate synthase/folylpolyglutamate synthase [Nitrosospira sp. Nsp2]|uniref:bifunctional tetrahydrofolate synthase/dihydrofolate synthase n=1 Tax=Nitrosospira sp. Nsp2 TaxID=136548 RepID=UPI000D300DFC|nr:bifunctional tetrahydrofolate synthase/dihydrofolate synthase [Nitrosospira sp. Nsp2]PTR17262.1 dihydrofolate synthase/folylpolyglutamate synthase [Nitrosospira sp. Nsp2]